VERAKKKDMKGERPSFSLYKELGKIFIHNCLTKRSKGTDERKEIKKKIKDETTRRNWKCKCCHNLNY
jgi:hypothetical protein